MYDSGLFGPVYVDGSVTFQDLTVVNTLGPSVATEEISLGWGAEYYSTSIDWSRASIPLGFEGERTITVLGPLQSISE